MVTANLLQRIDRKANFLIEILQAGCKCTEWSMSVITDNLGENGGGIFASSTKGACAALFLSFWLFGGMLYLWLIALIFYGYMFFKFEPSDLIPPY
ncbi:MAG: hypothetical protein U0105_13780 [Candidatus Obscuribacterales bacterium]